MSKSLGSKVIYYVRKNDKIKNWKYMVIDEKTRSVKCHRDNGSLGYKYTWRKEYHEENFLYWETNYSNTDFDRIISHKGRDKVFETLYF